MAESIGALRVELSANAARLDADLGRARQSLQRTGAQFNTFQRTAIASSRQVSAGMTSVRFAAISMVGRIHPALGQLTSLGSVAVATGGSLASLAGVAGIGLLVAGLGLLIRKTFETESALKGVQAAIDSSDATKMKAELKKLETSMTSLQKELKAAEAGSISFWRRFQQAAAAAAGGEASGLLRDVPDALGNIRSDLGELEKKGAEPLKSAIASDEAIEAAKKLAKSIADLKSNLEFELAQLQRNAVDQRVATELRRLGISATDKEAAAIRKKVQAIFDEQSAIATAAAAKTKADTLAKESATAELALLDEGERLRLALRSEQEKLNDELARAHLLFDQGVIGAETFDRALEDLAERAKELRTGIPSVREEMEHLNVASQIFAVQAAGAFTSAITGAESAADAMKRLLKSLIDTSLQAAILAGILGAMGVPSGQMGGLSGVFGKIMGFQRGGVVPGPPSRPTLAMLHGGETVVPAGDTSFGSTVINVDARGAQPGVGREVQRAVAEAIAMAEHRAVARVVDEQRRSPRFGRR